MLVCYTRCMCTKHVCMCCVPYLHACVCDINVTNMCDICTQIYMYMYTNIHVHVHKYTRAYRHLCKHATPRFFFEFYFQNKIENDTNRHLCKHSSTGVHSRNVGQKQRAYIPPTSFFFPPTSLFFSKKKCTGIGPGTGVHSRNVGQQQRTNIPPTSPCATAISLQSAIQT